MVRSLILLFALLGLSSCSPSADGGGDLSASSDTSMFLDDSRLREMEARAKSGDIDAMRAIAAHYDFAVSAPDKAVPWLEMAVVRGSSKAMRGLAIHLAVTGGEQNCRRAEALLLNAIRQPDDPAAKHKSELSLASLRGGVGAGRCAEFFQP